MGPLPRRDAILLGSAAVLAAATAVVTALTGVPYLGAMARGNGLALDFGIFYRSAAALRAGGEIYPAGQPNFSPPAAVAAFVPLTVLAPVDAYRLFAAVSLVALLAAVVWLALGMRVSRFVTAVAVVAVLLSPALSVTLAQGQVYALLAVGLAVAFVLDGHDRPVPAGIALGIVVAVKPFLAPVLLWPLARGRRREAVAGLATAVVVTLAGILAAGPTAVAGYLRVLRAGFPEFDIDNASLTTTGLRLVTPGRDIPPLVDAPWLGWVGGVVAIGLLALTLARRADHGAGLWPVVAACLLASPLAWRGYLLLLVPGAVALLGRDRTRALGVLLLVVLLLPHRTPLLFPPDSTGYVLSTLVGPAALLALWVGLYAAGERESVTGAAADRGTSSRV